MAYKNFVDYLIPNHVYIYIYMYIYIYIYIYYIYIYMYNICIYQDLLGKFVSYSDGDNIIIIIIIMFLV